MNDKLKEIEIYAKYNKVPIMLPDGIAYLCNYIKEHHIKNILEIGTAIGYSAIKMALVSNDIMVTSIEKDDERYEIAINNIQKFNLDNQIKVIHDDALKGHNIDFFNRYSPNLSKNGVIITDNLHFHGLVKDELLIKTKNQKGIVKKIKNFIEFLDNHQEYMTIYIDIGDGLSISSKRS